MCGGSGNGHGDDPAQPGSGSFTKLWGRPTDKTTPSGKNGHKFSPLSLIVNFLRGRISAA